MLLFFLSLSPLTHQSKLSMQTSRHTPSFILPFAPILCLVTQLCLTLCYPMDCSLLGSSVHGILQARVLEGAAISFSREISTQGWNRHLLSLLHCRQTRYPPAPNAIYYLIIWITMVFSLFSFLLSGIYSQPTARKNLYKTSFQLILRTLRIKWKLFTRTGGLPNMALSCHSAVISNNIPSCTLHSTYTSPLFHKHAKLRLAPGTFPYCPPSLEHPIPSSSWSLSACIIQTILTIGALYFRLHIILPSPAPTLFHFPCCLHSFWKHIACLLSPCLLPFF